MNMYHENLGARRLHEITEKIIEDLSFNCPDYSGQVVTIDANYVV
jgi:ATP-dependent HslUV protease ATP-binding subunit HslU